MCELQAPLGDLFSWIDAGFHEHGGQPWAVLQLGLAGQPFESLAARLIEVDNMQPSSGPLEVEDTGERDLQRSMLGIHLDTVAEDIANAAKLPQSDPSRIDRAHAAEPAPASPATRSESKLLKNCDNGIM